MSPNQMPRRYLMSYLALHQDPPVCIGQFVNNLLSAITSPCMHRENSWVYPVPILDVCALVFAKDCVYRRTT